MVLILKNKTTEIQFPWNSGNSEYLLYYLIAHRETVIHVIVFIISTVLLMVLHR